MIALPRADAALRVAGRDARRQYRLNIAAAYRRERHLRDVAPWLCADPMSPMRQVKAGWLNNRPETTKALLADMMHHVRARMQSGKKDLRLEALRGALRAEIVTYYRQRKQQEAA